MPAREETTTFAGGACAACDGPTYSIAENGVCCEQCGRRVVFGREPVSEERQEQPQEQPIFRLMPRGREDQPGPDGGLYRVHTFFVVNESGQAITEETEEGPQPIILQSVPMRIKKPSRLAKPPGVLIH